MMNCSLYEAEIMTMREYSFEVDKKRLLNLKKAEDMHLQAFLNHAVTAEKKVGKGTKPLFSNFTDFFDYEKEYDHLVNPQYSEKDKKIINLFVQANS